MARYKAAAAVFLQPDDHAGARRFEPGEEFVYSGRPSVAMIPIDAEARRAKRATLPDAWPRDAQPWETMRVALGLGAPHTSTLVDRRRIIERFIADNPTAA